MLVVLKLGFGSWQEGFPAVIAQMGTDSDPYQKQLTASLPPAPDLPQLYRRWHLFYLALYERLEEQFRITFDENEEIPTNVSQAEFDQLCQQLRVRCNDWLNSAEFRPIYQKLWRDFSPDTEIRLLIETEDPQLRQFPWHLWDFLTDYPNAEIALSNPRHERMKANSSNSSEQVRILAILGDSQKIDLEKDRAILEELNPAKATFMVNPSRKDLIDQMWRHEWDIFFFAGHSFSHIEEAKGQMALDESQNVSMRDLQNALRHMIAKGLQIAIFNSCQGLGLVQELENLELYIPQIIVMREAVPDKVAQEFLTYFLEELAEGESFYLAVRKAREHLQSLEDEFPCASWLPVICQNPAVVPPTWESLRRIERRKLQPVFWGSLVATGLVVAMRSLGMLQGLELETFDQMLRLRPNELIDPRLLIVTVTDADIQREKKYPISDRTLGQLLTKLQSYQPRAIGLDIYRDLPVEPGHQDFISQMAQEQRLITVCEVGDTDNPGIAPPQGIPVQRQGFTDFLIDFDGVVRRHLLAMTPSPASLCTTEFSFSLRLAQLYLAAEGIKSPETEVLEFEGIIFTLLKSQTGGYHSLDARGYQILLNYRFPQVAQQVTLSQVLNGQIDPNLVKLVKNRVILIGVDSHSMKDHFRTPYSRGKEEMSGVMMHAQMTSQILSRVLDNRPLLWVWHPIVEILWIWGWSLVGGLITWRFSSWLILGLAEVIALPTLTGICFVFLLQGGWIPLIPSALALIFCFLIFSVQILRYWRFSLKKIRN